MPDDLPLLDREVCPIELCIPMNTNLNMIAVTMDTSRPLKMDTNGSTTG